MAPISAQWLGELPYAEGLALQAREVEARRRSDRDRLLLLEHPPVVTLGRSWRPENLLVSRDALAARGIEVHEVARGGDVTYHGPGQLVGYPIVDLAQRGRDVHRFLRDCEQALIDALAELGLPARRIEGKTGVFVQRGGEPGPDRKIASIGVGVKRWITCHGFALNATIDLRGFEAIVPCGLKDVEMTSVARELARRGGDRDSGPDPEERRRIDAAVREAVLAAFECRFA